MNPAEHRFRLAEAHGRYAILRDVAFQEACRAATAAGFDPSVRLTSITTEALTAWRSSWVSRHWTGEGGFPWDLLARRYRQKPRAFHVAVWAGSTLCGLAVGWVSAGRRDLVLHFMESAPDPDHPLRGTVTYLVFTAAEFYVRAVGGNRLLLRNPLPGVRARYGAFGFSLVREEHGNVYYCKEIP